MDRKDIIRKIKAMMKLQEASSFDGEASNAAKMIDRLCKEHGISLTEAMYAQIYKEVVMEGSIRNYIKFVWQAVANFYDAKIYYVGTSMVLLGSEAQQIQTRLYSEYIMECLNRESQKAYEAEKFLAELQGRKVPGRRFIESFKVAFSMRVVDRLEKMKEEEQRVHPDAKDAKAAVEQLNLRKGKTVKVKYGSGFYAGHAAGSEVSLRRQASGSTTKQLAGV